LAVLAAVLAGVALCGIAMSCTSSATAPAQAGSAADSKSQVAAAEPKTGVQLWVENCGRCHNLRGPDWRTPAAREVALSHMRLRVPLTGEDQRAIHEFFVGQ
jgi:cytochrome c553